MNLAGKKAIVTGAGRGIGRATAIALARAGVAVSVSARTQDDLFLLKQEIEGFGGTVFLYTGDMSLEQDIKNFVKATISEFSALDFLVNNAGIGRFGNVSEMSTVDWDLMFDLNVRGTFLMTRECLPHLRKSGSGAVVNVVSIAGKNTFAGGSGYAATKHAVLAFSRCLMLEERKNSIRVMAICPGSVNTDFNFPSDVDTGKRKRILTSENIADSILFTLQIPQNALISELDIRPSNP